MSFSAIENLQLGKFLQISFSEGIRLQISEDYRDWEYIKREKIMDPNGREHRFLVQRSLGPAAVQYRNPNGSASFPTAQQVSSTEARAFYKEIDTTIELEYNLWKAASKSIAKYVEPLAIEIQSKLTASKRRLANDLYGDGTGVVGTVSSASDTTGANGYTTVSLSTSSSARGFVGSFEFDDLLLAYTSAGVAVTPTVVGTFYAWRVKSKDRRNDQVVLEAVNSSGTVLNLTASSLSSGHLFYRVGQPTIPDLTASISDYGTVTEVIPGLESLTANDGRVVHALTMSGALSGTRLDASGNPIDVALIHDLMDQVKINTGAGRYTWKQIVSAPEALAALIESRETDRRFTTVEDSTRGVKKFVYQHLDSSLEFVVSEYCPKKRMYMIPEGKSGDRVLESHISDFEPVKAQDMSEFHLKPSSSGGFQRTMTSFMMGMGTLICKHPAAVGVLTNFSF